MIYTLNTLYKARITKEYEEEKHPRDEKGKFTAGEGSQEPQPKEGKAKDEGITLEKPTAADKKYIMQVAKPTVDFKIENKMQNQQTGETAYLLNTVRNNWYVLWSSGDISDFEKDGEAAKKYFMGFVGKSDII